MIISPQTASFSSPRGFIVLEGVNGSGKSTLLKKILEGISAAGKTPVSTFEPGGSELGKTLRRLLLESTESRPGALAELILFIADRAEHVSTVIQPALERSEVVVSDRYLYSSVAFQGYGRGVDLSTVSELNRIAVQDVLPDLVILLDLDPVEGLRRTQRRNPESARSDIFEAESVAFHTRIREGFLSLADTRPEPFLVIDASQPAEVVAETALLVISRLLKSMAGA